MASSSTSRRVSIWLERLLAPIDQVLRSSAGSDGPLPLARLVGTTVVCGLLYGAVMGSYAGLAPDRWQQVVFSAVKVPLLILVAFALSLPSFYVFNAVLGLAGDFRAAVRSLAATQSCLAIVLVSLAPLTAFWYASAADYRSAITFNGLMFAVASCSSQILLRRHYGALIARNRRHRFMLIAWLIVYVFVAVQFAWIMRPFVGDPGQPPQFFRNDPLADNAYVFVARLAWRLVRHLLLLE
jgi:hypothetical protein